ncbi:DUF2779 domain-containing protein [Pedobacter puniceum]|uniref:DUF2779 domain-containing protein n=1 Tax=Pedobacter puniceum TaxID=2666136 RepID=A0A7K0FIM3_9SPHI|nr:DUF2779 domain-containing protein [Pedobacter puniceum]MRX45826.1 DUF2779 domain-containing protein [Pedobacter puniceum]
MSELLSKSDYKIGASCAKKLIYKKSKYPSTLANNEYMLMLAEGGYLIGKYAILHFPEGIEVEDDIELGEIQTTNYLREQENVTLFEATVVNNQKIIRIDILQKEGGVLNLIEVKSKSFDSESGNIKKELSSELEDIAYQKLVLQDAYPNFKINCFLFIPDKSKSLKIDNLISWFSVDETKISENQNFKKPDIAFLYSLHSPEHQFLIEKSFLSLINVNDEIDDILPTVKHKSNKLLNVLNYGINPDDIELTTKCFSCEYQAENKSGFKECWGKLADIKPSISSLYHLGTLGGKINPTADVMIKNGQVSFFDLKPEYFYKANKVDIGSRGKRQIIQYENTLNNTEWFSSSMKDELESWIYPLHFIDFETYAGAMPHHKGMRPYEIVAFQWSCHTIIEPDAAPIHSEWINTENTFPNFRFAESLMKQIGYDGTPLMWATHENTVLRTILYQMESFNYENEELRNWLLGITKDKQDGREGRLLDMNAFTFNHYFHPQMEGKTSIKKVLPAIWNNNEYLHQIEWLKEYVGFDVAGIIKSPYDKLSGLMADLEKMEAVKDGTAAMKAYYDMQYGSTSKDNIKKETLKQLLLQYCKLDTMAMVIIWKYWMDKLNDKS